MTDKKPKKPKKPKAPKKRNLDRIQRFNVTCWKASEVAELDAEVERVGGGAAHGTRASRGSVLREAFVARMSEFADRPVSIGRAEILRRAELLPAEKAAEVAELPVPMDRTGDMMRWLAAAIPANTEPAAEAQARVCDLNEERPVASIARDELQADLENIERGMMLAFKGRMVDGKEPALVQKHYALLRQRLLAVELVSWESIPDTWDGMVQLAKAVPNVRRLAAETLYEVVRAHYKIPAFELPELPEPEADGPPSDRTKVVTKSMMTIPQLQKLLTIPPPLAAMGLSWEMVLDRIELCRRQKKVGAWQMELDRLAPLVERFGVTVLDTYQNATTAGWQGCTPKMVMDLDASPGANWRRSGPPSPPPPLAELRLVPEIKAQRDRLLSEMYEVGRELGEDSDEYQSLQHQLVRMVSDPANHEGGGP